MSALVDVGLIDDVKRFGAADVSACFSCGQCTAMCPLSSNDGTFPRRLIRYAQVGMKDALLSSKELWTCFYCGECSDTCPTQADPGGFMAAARRYAIASYDKTRLAKTMYTKPVLGTLIALVLAAFFALFMYREHGPQHASALKLFDFIPEPLIHYTGVAVMALVGLAGLAGILSAARSIAKKEGLSLGSVVGRGAGKAWWSALWTESLGQKRYRSDCQTAQEASPWYRKRWLIHAMTMWGFLGLFAATIIDYGLALIHVKPTGAEVPIWYPVRLLGTLAGLALIYGTTMLIVDRLRKANRSASDSTFADWLLLTLLWITGVTGFGIELALYLPHAPAWGYWVFLVHVSIAMELMLLLPFTKFAHAIYRPVALFFVARGKEKEAGPG